MGMWIIWLIIAFIMLVGEIICTTFFMFWFSLGAFSALIASLIFPGNLIVQILVFLIVSFTLLIFTKPLTAKFLSSKSKVQSNVEALIGQKARVIQDINSFDQTGKVKLSSEVWKAVSENQDEIIPTDSEVTVVSVDGVKLVVKK